MNTHQQQPLAPQENNLAGWTSARGTALNVTSQQSLSQAREMMAACETSSPIPESHLPVGTNWQILRVVTEQGLVPHFTQPGMIEQVDHRGDNSLAGTKRRIGEE